jgi:hypothetical protein
LHPARKDNVMTEEAPQALQQEELMMAIEEAEAYGGGAGLMAELESLESRSGSGSEEAAPAYEAELARMEKSESTPAMAYEAADSGSNPFAMEASAARSMSASDESTMSQIESSEYSAEQSAVSAEESENAANEAADEQSDAAFDQYISE